MSQMPTKQEPPEEVDPEPEPLPEWQMVRLNSTTPGTDYSDPRPWMPEYIEVDVEISRLSFQTIDIDHGPPDVLSFCDSLTIEAVRIPQGELYSYDVTVASPEGLRRNMDEGDLRALYFTQMFIFRKYDLDFIREALLEYVRREIGALVNSQIEEDSSAKGSSRIN